jgi:hypothetical protein
MNFLTNSGLTCRFCRHYDPVGRRGGNCQKLQASVEATWEACSLAIPAFDNDWETPAEIANSYSAQAAGKVNQKVVQQEEQYKQLIEETLLEYNSLTFARLKQDS